MSLEKFKTKIKLPKISASTIYIIYNPFNKSRNQQFYFAGTHLFRCRRRLRPRLRQTVCKCVGFSNKTKYFSINRIVLNDKNMSLIELYNKKLYQIESD